MKENYCVSDPFAIKKEDMSTFHSTEVFKARYFPKVTSNISL